MEQRPLITEKTIKILREYIGRLQAQEAIKIPSERELSKNLSVSRVSIRTAIKKLVAEGLLTQAQGKGTYISPIKRLSSIHILCPQDIKKSDPFYNKFLVEITSEAARRGLILYIIDPDKIIGNKEDTPLITIGVIENVLLNKLNPFYKKIISIQDFSNHKDIIQLHFDDYNIGLKAGQLLIKYGHQKIMHLSGPAKFPSAVLRKLGFQDAIINSQYKYYEYSTKMNWTGGYSAGDYILDSLPAEERPTGVFAANDWMAEGLIQKLKERGVQVPTDISIIGCDDIQLATELRPQLTTFNLDMKLLISKVFDILTRYEEIEIYNQKILIPAELILRESLTSI